MHYKQTDIKCTQEYYEKVGDVLETQGVTI